MKKLVLLLGLLSLASLLVMPAAFAQTVTSNLSGIVTDATGAVLPGAKVVLTDEATKSSNTSTTNGGGHFNFTGIFPGTYDLKVTAEGFQTFNQKGVILHQNESRSVNDIAMKPGAASQEVTVTAETETVPMDSGASSTTLNNTMVSQTAIQGRDAAELIRLMPGMAINSGLGNTEWNSALTQINNGPIGSFAANGTQPNGSMQLISNGSVITDAGNQGTQIANINQDMTQEVTMQDSAFDAEYAHGPVTFSSVGKRGSHDFHGEVYGYGRNGSLNAEDAFLKSSGIKKQIDHYWYEGGNIGGPVIIPGTGFNKSRNKAFFFVGFEHLNQLPNGTLHEYVVPTPSMMAGDFTQSSLSPYTSAFGSGGGSGAIPCADNSGFWNFGNFCENAVNNGTVTLYDQNGVAYNGAAYLAADGCVSSNHAGGCTSPAVSGATISPSIIDSNGGLVLMKLLNGAPGLQMIDPATNGGFNARYLDKAAVNGNELNLRGDVNVTEKMKAFATFTRQTEGDINNIGLWWWAPASVPYPSQTPANQISRTWSIGVTNTFSASMINEASFGYAYFINPVGLANPKAADPSTYGYNVTTPYAQPVPQIPDIVSWCCSPGGGGNSPSKTSSAGFQASSFGSNPNWYGKYAGKDSYTPDFSDNFTLVKGAHTMKFGFFWAKYANVQTEGACCGGGTVGQWDFDPWANNSTTNIYADMLLGNAQGFGMASQNFTDNVVYNEYSFFAQDRWQAMRRLTLSFGVRFNREGQWYPANENQGIMLWDPNNTVQPLSGSSALAGFTWHGIDKNVPISGWPTHNFFPDPHVGVAYDLFGNGKTVLRGGFGVYRFNVAYNDVTENGMLDAPLGLKSFSSNCVFTGLATLATCGAATAGSKSSQSYGGMMAGDNKNPYTESWNVMISQRAPWKSTFELQYKGNRSRNLLLSANGAGGVQINNINYIPEGNLFKPDPVSGITYFCQGTASATCVSGGPPSLTDFRPLPYTAVFEFRHGSFSNYNGFVAQWIKQTGPAVFTLNYTWSHVLGIRDGNNDNGQGSGAALDAFNLQNNYGTLAFNRYHIFNASYVINLPKPIHNNYVLGGIVNGWQLSGVTQYQTGVPIQPLSGTGLNPNFGSGISNQSILGTDGIALEPYLTCNPASHLASGQYFNPSCFAEPATRGVNGPLIWPTVVTPAFFDTDLGIYKNFKIHESQAIQFRLTAFNLPNHPLSRFGLNNDVNLQFGCPTGQTCTSPSQWVNTNASTDGRPHAKIGNRSLEYALKYTF